MSLSTPRITGLALAVGGLGLAYVGLSMKIVRFGQSVVQPQMALRDIDKDLQHTAVTIVLVGVACALLAQLPYQRYLAAISGGAAAGLVAVAAEALDRAADLNVIIKAVVNPRPAVGFYVCVAGGLLGGVGALIILLTTRSTQLEASTGNASRSDLYKASAAVVRAADPRQLPSIGLPSTTPGWQPDPTSLGTGRMRWWDGTHWTSTARDGVHLPAPGPPSESVRNQP